MLMSYGSVRYQVAPLKLYSHRQFHGFSLLDNNIIGNANWLWRGQYTIQKFKKDDAARFDSHVSISILNFNKTVHVHLEISRFASSLNIP